MPSISKDYFPIEDQETFLLDAGTVLRKSWKTDLRACTAYQKGKILNNFWDDNHVYPWDELYEDDWVLLSEKEIQEPSYMSDEVGFDNHAEDIEADQDPVKKIVVETLITEWDEWLQDLVVIKPENGIVWNHGKMRPRTCPRKMR